MTAGNALRWKNKKRAARGAVTLEYIIVAAMLILAAASLVPETIVLFGYAYEVLAAVVGSPFPSGF